MIHTKHRKYGLQSAAAAGCLLVSALVHAAATDWVDFYPPGGNHLPVRFYQGQVECASTDGVNCKWSGWAAAVPSYAASLQPLRCGADHMEKWNTDGYSYPGHWCSAAYAELYATWEPGSSGSTPGTTLTGYFSETPVSVTTTGQVVGGDVQCLSFNHHDCVWQQTNLQSLSAGGQPVLSRVQPLVCGAMHSKEWGQTGYTNSQHWCSIVNTRYRPPAVATINPADCLSLSAQDPTRVTNTGSCAPPGVLFLAELTLNNAYENSNGKSMECSYTSASGLTCDAATGGVNSIQYTGPTPSGGSFISTGGSFAVTGTGFLLPAPVPYPLASDYSGSVGDLYVDTSTGSARVFQLRTVRTPGDGSAFPVTNTSNQWWSYVGNCAPSCAAAPFSVVPTDWTAVTPTLWMQAAFASRSVVAGAPATLDVTFKRQDTAMQLVNMSLTLPAGVSVAPSGGPKASAAGCAGPTSPDQKTWAVWLQPNVTQCSYSWVLNTTAGTTGVLPVSVTETVFHLDPAQGMLLPLGSATEPLSLTAQ